ncbi:MAG: carboxy terminal-processing peptidase [Bdellovibrionales bacterium]|nr:carboxy terminal-processing peptidase [Bdellovibrionales bacterium]
MFARRSISLFIVLGTFLSGGVAHASNLSCAVLPQLFNLYFRFHYVHRNMTDEIKAHTVDQYIKTIDPSKTLLLQGQVDTLKKNLLATFKTMDEGDCKAIEESQDALVKGAEENEKFAKEFLGDKYALDESAELVTDPDKRKFSKDLDEKKALLKKMIHFQITNEMLSKTKLPEAKKNVIHRYELDTKRTKEKKLSDREVDFAESFALALDPHSSYMSADSLEEFRIQMQLSLEGIGASLSSQNGFTLVEEVIPGGAADRAKVLQPKDKIIAVAQAGQKAEPVVDMDLQDVVKRIRGKKGTKVTLTILRQGDTNKTFDVTIVRDKIDIKESAAKITYETKKVGDKSFKIGVIDLPSFYGGGREGRSSADDMRKLVLEAKKNKVDGLVIDLSRNGGGLLDDAVKIAGLFMKKAAVVATKGSDQRVDVLADRDDETAFSGPLMVLTSRLSASASEILAGALKDYHRALIVGGDHTYGKGTVQVVSDLPQGLGAMKVSTGMFFIPAGASTQHQGVESDIELPSVFSTDDIGEKTMDYSLPPQKIPSFVSSEANDDDAAHHWKPIDGDLVKKLKKLSQERVSKDSKFAEIVKSIEDAKKNKGVIRLAEMKKKAEEENKKDDKKEKNRKAKLKETQAPLVSEGINIMTDWLASGAAAPTISAR